MRRKSRKHYKKTRRGGMRIRLPFRRRVKLEPVKALPVNEDELVPVVVDYEVENCKDIINEIKEHEQTWDDALNKPSTAKNIEIRKTARDKVNKLKEKYAKDCVHEALEEDKEEEEEEEN